MSTSTAAGRPAAPALRYDGVDALLADARSRGIRRISLETGSAEFFRPAHALYARAGFVECAPFGSYLPDPHSTFMTVELGDEAQSGPSGAIMEG